MQPLRLKNSVATLGAPKPIRYIFPVNALTPSESGWQKRGREGENPLVPR